MKRTPSGEGAAKHPKILLGITYEEDGWFYAVCLNHFLMTVAKEPDGIEDAILSMVRSHAAACRKRGVRPFEDLGLAPDEYWERWFTGSPALRKDPSEEVPLELLLGYEFRLASAASSG